MKAKTQDYQVRFRRFNENDIEKKVQWINDDEVNRFLHYDLPLIIEKTRKWYEKIKNNRNRYDGVIEIIKDNKVMPIGLIGLLNIDEKNNKAEFYICIGEKTYWGSGLGESISKQFIKYALKELNLNKIYLYTEEENIKAQKLFKVIGFEKEGLLLKDIIYRGIEINRFIYAIYREDYL